MAGLLVAANVAGYIAMAYDKRAARLSRRANPPDRVPENGLWGIAAFGGFPAMIVAIARLRHKTRKRRFLFVFFAAGLGSTIAWTGWLSAAGCVPGIGPLAP